MHATTFATSPTRPSQRRAQPLAWRLEIAHDPQLIITACILLAFVAGVVCFVALFAQGTDARALAGV